VKRNPGLGFEACPGFRFTQSGLRLLSAIGLGFVQAGIGIVGHHPFA
jgi:hypothetical protein